MKKIFTLILSIFVLIMCVPCNVFAEKNTKTVPFIAINYYENGENKVLYYKRNEQQDTNIIEGLDIYPAIDELGYVYYTIQISKDIDIDFITNDENNACIIVNNAGFKIISVNGDHTINFNYLGDTTESSEISKRYVIRCNIPSNYEETTSSGFGDHNNRLTINFNDVYHNDEGEYGNPLIGIQINDDDYMESSLGKYNFEMININSFSTLSGAYYVNYFPNDGITTHIYDCDIAFRNIDAFDYNEKEIFLEEYDRGFLRLNGGLVCEYSNLNAYLNDIKMADVNDNEQTGGFTKHIASIGISTNTDAIFNNSEIHLEGIAGLATRANITFQNTNVDVIGRWCGILLYNTSNIGSMIYVSEHNNYFNAETLCDDPINITFLGKNFNIASSIVSPFGYNLQFKLSGDKKIYVSEKNRYESGDAIEPSSILGNKQTHADAGDDNYQELISYKRIMLGYKPLDFDYEIRYLDNSDHIKSFKFKDGNKVEGSDDLPSGLEFVASNDSDYPYMLKVTGDVVLRADSNDLFRADYITEYFNVGYCICFNKGLLIKGDENSSLTFDNVGTFSKNMFFYDIISNQDVSSNKLKIDIPKLAFNYTETDRESSEKKVFANQITQHYDAPHLVDICAFDINIENVKQGAFLGSYNNIDYYVNLNIKNCENIVFKLIPYNCYNEDSFAMIMCDIEGGYVQDDFSSFNINHSKVVFNAKEFINNNKAMVAAVMSMNVDDASKSAFNITNDSNVEIHNATLMLGPSNFEGSELLFNNTDSMPALSNIFVYSGPIKFNNCDYSLIANGSNIEYFNLPLGGAYFGIEFNQDGQHTGTLESKKNVCINSNTGTVTKGDNTVINAYIGGQSSLYDDALRTSYNKLVITGSEEAHELKRIDLKAPTKDEPGTLPYYYDEKTGTYYKDKNGTDPIDNLTEWLKGEGVMPSISHTIIMGTIDSTSSDYIIPLNNKTIVIPVSNNKYAFKSDASFDSNFVCVIVNGDIINSPKDYTVTSGSTIVKLTDDFINISLKEGKNSIYIVSKDGSSYEEFTVIKPKQPDNPVNPGYVIPKTGIK